MTRETRSLRLAQALQEKRDLRHAANEQRRVQQASTTSKHVQQVDPVVRRRTILTLIKEVCHCFQLALAHVSVPEDTTVARRVGLREKTKSFQRLPSPSLEI